MIDDAPHIEVTLAIDAAADRRLTTAEAVRTLIDSPTADDEKLNTIIDGVTADCVTYCGLARAIGGTPATFGFEEFRVTWRITSRSRGSRLQLPWRTPVTAVMSVIENDAELVEGTDFQLLGDGVIERLSGDRPICWSTYKIVVEFAAGWELPDGPPADLVAKVTDQVKMLYLSRSNNPALRSDSTDGVGAESFYDNGGGTIGESGLLRSLESALTPFRSWVVP